MKKGPNIPFHLTIEFSPGWERPCSKCRFMKFIFMRFGKEFIEEKMLKFVEPVRKGVRKGDKVGFSRPKYHAALLHILYPLFIKSLAELSVLSESSSVNIVRVWRTEKTFQDMVSERRRQFNQVLEKNL